jgi:hypothetical protein
MLNPGSAERIAKLKGITDPMSISTYEDRAAWLDQKVKGLKDDPQYRGLSDAGKIQLRRMMWNKWIAPTQKQFGLPYIPEDVYLRGTTMDKLDAIHPELQFRNRFGDMATQLLGDANHGVVSHSLYGMDFGHRLWMRQFVTGRLSDRQATASELDEEDKASHEGYNSYLDKGFDRMRNYFQSGLDSTNFFLATHPTQTYLNAVAGKTGEAVITAPFYIALGEAGGAVVGGAAALGGLGAEAVGAGEAAAAIGRAATNITTALNSSRAGRMVASSLHGAADGFLMSKVIQDQSWRQAGHEAVSWGLMGGIFSGAGELSGDAAGQIKKFGANVIYNGGKQLAFALQDAAFDKIMGRDFAGVRMVPFGGEAPARGKYGPLEPKLLQDVPRKAQGPVQELEGGVFDMPHPDEVTREYRGRYPTRVRPEPGEFTTTGWGKTPETQEIKDYLEGQVGLNDRYKDHEPVTPPERAWGYKDEEIPSRNLPEGYKLVKTTYDNGRPPKIRIIDSDNVVRGRLEFNPYSEGAIPEIRHIALHPDIQGGRLSLDMMNASGIERALPVPGHPLSEQGARAANLFNQRMIRLAEKPIYDITREPSEAGHLLHGGEYYPYRDTSELRTQYDRIREKIKAEQSGERYKAELEKAQIRDEPGVPTPSGIKTGRIRYGEREYPYYSEHERTQQIADLKKLHEYKQTIAKRERPSPMAIKKGTMVYEGKEYPFNNEQQRASQIAQIQAAQAVKRGDPLLDKMIDAEETGIRTISDHKYGTPAVETLKPEQRREVIKKNSELKHEANDELPYRMPQNMVEYAEGVIKEAEKNNSVGAGISKELATLGVNVPQEFSKEMASRNGKATGATDNESASSQIGSIIERKARGTEGDIIGLAATRDFYGPEEFKRYVGDGGRNPMIRMAHQARNPDKALRRATDGTLVGKRDKRPWWKVKQDKKLEDVADTLRGMDGDLIHFENDIHEVQFHWGNRNIWNKSDEGMKMQDLLASVLRNEYGPHPVTGKDFSFKDLDNFSGRLGKHVIQLARTGKLLAHPETGKPPFVYRSSDFVGSPTKWMLQLGDDVTKTEIDQMEIILKTHNPEAATFMRNGLNFLQRMRSLQVNYTIDEWLNYTNAIDSYITQQPIADKRIAQEIQKAGWATPQTVPR